MSRHDQHRYDEKERTRIRRNLVRWYTRHARDLPWRRTTDPYRIWISEIMLQQTTVKAVIGYYARFLDTFPTVEELAAAPEEKVLRQWEGLGYYSRARNIHRAAKVIVNELAGKFPKDIENLLRLPGIGRYTAGAIASFAFDQVAPIVEANTQRLYSRLLGYAGDIRSTAGQNLLWKFAEELVPRKSPGRFNQALMELGATLCTPMEPGCESCPLRQDCTAFRDGTQHTIPNAARRPEITDMTEVAVIVRSGGRFLLRRRSAGERWAGLWDFPRFPIEAGTLSTTPNKDATQPPRIAGASTRARKKLALACAQQCAAPPLALSIQRELQKQLRAQSGLTIEFGDVIAEMKHSVTRYRIRLVCVTADCRSGTIREPGILRWVPPSGFEDYPLSTTGRKIANLLSKKHLGQSYPAAIGR